MCRLAGNITLLDHLVVNAVNPGLELGLRNWLWLRINCQSPVTP